MAKNMAWYRRQNASQTWGLQELFLIPDDGPVRMFDPIFKLPEVMIQHRWDVAQDMTYQAPEISMLSEVDPADLPFLELQIELRDKARKGELVEHPEMYFVIYAPAGPDVNPEEIQPVAYGRIIEIVESGQMAKAIILGASGDIRPIQQTLWKEDQDMPGFKVVMAAELFPGHVYFLKIGAESMLIPATKPVIQSIRGKNSDWVHVPDPELDSV